LGAGLAKEVLGSRPLMEELERQQRLPLKLLRLLPCRE